MARLARVLRRHPWLCAALALVLALVLGFALRMGHHLRDWPQEEPLAPWMTIGYVARPLGLDPREIDRRAGFPPPDQAGRPLTLGEIAHLRGETLDQTIAHLREILAGMAPRGPGRP